jgi:outer membrane biosynthesis protein TonB
MRDGCVKQLPYSEMERGKAGTLLTFATIGQDGSVHGLHVIDRSGDEQMLTRTLEALRSSGFEPARLGDQNVAINFLYLFTTTEVRLPAKKFISDAFRLKKALS